MPNEMMEILVVDDNPVLLSLLSEMFMDHGYIARTASDGVEALAVIRDRVPDILISDLNMTRMSGFELLSVVRRRFPTIAFIAMSSGRSAATTSPGMRLTGFMPKAQAASANYSRSSARSATKNYLSPGARQAPIWIPGLPVRQGDLSSVAVACPECLRVFTHPLKDGTIVTEQSCCPYCSYSLQLAIVKQLGKMDAQPSL